MGTAEGKGREGALTGAQEPSWHRAEGQPAERALLCGSRESRREVGDEIGDLSAAGRPAGRGGGSPISCPGRGDKGSGDKNRSEGAHLGSKEEFKGSQDRGLLLLAGCKAEKNKVTEQKEGESCLFLLLSQMLTERGR